MKFHQFMDKENLRVSVPLRVWLVLLVPGVSDHAAFSDLSTGSGDAHPFGSKPGETESVT